jgi:hypothetical protein
MYYNIKICELVWNLALQVSTHKTVNVTVFFVTCRIRRKKLTHGRVTLKHILRNSNLTVEMNHRVTMGNICCYGFQNLLRSKDTKCKLYKTINHL